MCVRCAHVVISPPGRPQEDLWQRRQPLLIMHIRLWPIWDDLISCWGFHSEPQNCLWNTMTLKWSIQPPLENKNGLSKMLYYNCNECYQINLELIYFCLNVIHRMIMHFFFSRIPFKIGQPRKQIVSKTVRNPQDFSLPFFHFYWLV